MFLEVSVLQSAAIHDERGDFLYRLGDDDPTITYEEFVVYYMCRYASGFDYIDPDYSFACWKKGERLLDRNWMKMAASKTHKMEIVHKWDEIFPKYKEKLAAKEAIYKAHGMELPPTPDKR